MRLALDTAFSACSVALADAHGNVLAVNHLEQRRGQAESLVPMIEDVLAKAGKEVGGINEIVLTTGPGTFAGVRIGVACARALALANNARIFGLSSFEALAGLVLLQKKPKPDTKILALIPGKRGEVSFQAFTVQKSGQPPFKSESPAKTIPETGLKAPKAAIIVGPEFDSGLEKALQGQTRIFAWPRAEDLLETAKLFPANRFQGTVSPFYLRPPDATPQNSGLG